jgi:colicin import membrane protein
MNPDRPPQLVRSGWDRGLLAMVGWSFALHVLVVAAVIFILPWSQLRSAPAPPSYTVELTTLAKSGTNVPAGAPGGPRGGARKRARAKPAPVKKPAPVETAKLATPEPAPSPKPVPPAPVEAEKPKEPEKPKKAEKPPEKKKTETPKKAATPAATKKPPPEKPAELAVPAKKKPAPETKKPAKTEPKPEPEAKPTAPATATAKKDVPAAAKEDVPAAAPKPAEPPAADAAGTEDAQLAAAIDRVRRRVEGGGMGGTAGGQGVPSIGGSGEGGGERVVGAEFLIYYNMMLSHIKNGWLWVGHDEGLTVTVRFGIAPNGEIRNIEIDRPSGNPTFDQSVMQAVSKANPLPPPPSEYRRDFGDVVLTFRPGDLRQPG